MMKGCVRGGLLGMLLFLFASSGEAQTTIGNDQTVSALNGSGGSQRFFQIELPSACTLRVNTWGGTGNMSVYLRRGALPTTSVYDARAVLAGTTKEITVPNAGAGWWYIMCYGPTDYSGVSLRARYWTEMVDGKTYLLSGAQESYRYFRLSVPAGQEVLYVATMDGAGDADLFIKRGDFPRLPNTYDASSETPNTNDEEIEIESPAGGDWYVMVRGYRAYNDLVLYGASAALGRWKETRTNLSAGAQGWVYTVVRIYHAFDWIHLQSWGGTGNADLYVRRGKPPMTYMDRYDQRSNGLANDEELRVQTVSTGTWWVGLYATGAFATGSFSDCKLRTDWGTQTSAQPTLNPAPGAYNTTQHVTISAGQGYARYTTDGSTPNPDSPRYQNPITISSTTTLKARVYSDQDLITPSLTRTGLYTITAAAVIPIYRFYSPVSRSHFYTRNEAEKNNIIANLSHAWNYEGTAWYAYATQVANTVPIYRFYSPVSRSHFYTRNEAEKNNIIANLSHAWNYEGIAWYAYATLAANTTPVYRFYSPVSGSHFYTRNQAERDHIIANLSHAWSYEGISYYAFAAPAGSSLGSPEVGDAMAAPGPAAPDFTALAPSALTVGEPVPVAGEEAAGGVFFPLTMDDTFVTAAVYDPAVAAWDQVLPVTWAPGGITCANLRRGQPYWLAILAHEAETETWVFEHGSWFGRRTAPAADVAVLDEAPTALGLPIETIRLPEADAPLTLQLYCPIEERNVLTATGLESGSAYDLTVPAWNRQYRLDVFDAHGELVLSTWLGHLRTH